MKKFLSLGVSCVIAMALLIGCKKKEEPTMETTTEAPAVVEEAAPMVTPEATPMMEVTPEAGATPAAQTNP